jgi:hypothetical protein
MVHIYINPLYFKYLLINSGSSYYSDNPVVPYNVTEEDMIYVQLFYDNPKNFFTIYNMKNRNLNKKWLHIDYYKSAGIQSFWHQDHASYKCQGSLNWIDLYS